MKIKHFNEAEEIEVNDYGSTNTTIRWLISKEKDGAPRFALRRFELKPGGQIGIHGHPQEHEIYILKGEGEVFTHYEKYYVKQDDVLYVPPDEPHGYRNSGKDDLVFLCVIPYLD